VNASTVSVVSPAFRAQLADLQGTIVLSFDLRILYRNHASIELLQDLAPHRDTPPAEPELPTALHGLCNELRHALLAQSASVSSHPILLHRRLEGQARGLRVTGMGLPHAQQPDQARLVLIIVPSP